MRAENIYHALYATRHTIHAPTGYAPASPLFGKDTLSILYVVAHGIPPVDEEGILNQLDDEDENQKDVEAAEREYAKNLRKEYAAAKNPKKQMGAIDRPEDIMPKRLRSQDASFLEGAERSKEMRANAAKNQEKKSKQNAKKLQRTKPRWAH